MSAARTPETDGPPVLHAAPKGATAKGATG